MSSVWRQVGPVHRRPKQSNCSCSHPVCGYQVLAGHHGAPGSSRLALLYPEADTSARDVCILTLLVLAMAGCRPILTVACRRQLVPSLSRLTQKALQVDAQHARLHMLSHKPLQCNMSGGVCLQLRFFRTTCGPALRAARASASPCP